MSNKKPVLVIEKKLPVSGKFVLHQRRLTCILVNEFKNPSGLPILLDLLFQLCSSSCFAKNKNETNHETCIFLMQEATTFLKQIHRFFTHI